MSTDSSLTSLELQPSDANVMVRFVGELNENLKFVEKTFNVKIFQNGIIIFLNQIYQKLRSMHFLFF